MKFIHLSDTHLSLDVPARAETFRVAIDNVKRDYADVDLVVHTGDITHNGSHEEYQLAREILSSLSMPYLVIPGNKDKRDAMLSVFDRSACQLNDGGFIQYSVENYEERLLMLDTHSEHSNKGEYCESRLHDLDVLLRQAPNRSTTVFMHHTPFKADPAPDPYQFERWQEVDKLSEVLNSHHQVNRIFCGHIHRNLSGELGNIPVSAISCMAVDLRKGDLLEHEKSDPMLNVCTV